MAHDLRLAARGLLRRPTLAAVVLVTLGLGIGANAAVFTVTHAVLLRPLPYERPSDVVVLHETTPQFGPVSVTRYNYEDWKERAASFTGMAAFRPLNMTVTGPGDPERVPVKMITASLLPLLGVQPAHGRNVREGEDRPGGGGVAVLGAEFANRRFGATDPLGRLVWLDGQPHTVVGVLPARFELFQPADVYLPFWPWAATLPEDRGWHPGIVPIARLAEGVSLAQAQREMDDISRQLEAEYPESNENVRAVVRRVQDQVVHSARPALLMLTGAGLIVLLIACANIANLLLARAIERQKEIALRLALGATRRRIVRQLLVESLVLAGAGGAAGLLLASWAVSFLEGPLGPVLPRSEAIAVNWPVVFFALALAVATGILFGLFPAVQATRMSLRDALNEESRTASAGTHHRRTRSVLVVSQVALALVLLVLAGLLLRSFASLTRVSPGFDPGNLLVVNLPLSPDAYSDPPARTSAAERILARLTRLPGVEHAAMTTGLPMTGPGATIHFNRAAAPPDGPGDYISAGYRAVTPEYLAALRVPLLEGRWLSHRDREGSPRVVVINESMARQYFADRNPVGERIQLGTVPSPDLPTLEIVGIVGDVRQSFAAGSAAEMFVPYAQDPPELLTPLYLNPALVVRTAVPPLELTAAVRAAVRDVDPGLPLVNVRTMTGAIGGTVAQPRLQVLLLGLFAGLAVVLAAVGVYGVMAYAVSQRVPEIGVRLALGASPERVVRMVVREGLRLTSAGMAIGLVLALLASHAVRGLLFGVPSLDPLSFLAAMLVLGLAALLASYLPARAASRISPLAAFGR